MTIWKEELALVANQSIELPVGSEILCVREQNGMGCLWFRFKDENKDNKEFRHFRTAGTGWDNGDDSGDYVGSYHLQSGALVFHVFEKKESAGD